MRKFVICSQVESNLIWTPYQSQEPETTTEKKKVIKNAYEIYVVCTEIKCKYNHIN